MKLNNIVNTNDTVNVINDRDIELIILTNVLTNSYDTWSKNKDIIDILNIDTNTICRYFKQLNPDIDNKIIQSITFGLLIYFLNNFSLLIHNQYKQYERNEIIYDK